MPGQSVFAVTGDGVHDLGSLVNVTDIDVTLTLGGKAQQLTFGEIPQVKHAGWIALIWANSDSAAGGEVSWMHYIDFTREDVWPYPEPLESRFLMWHLEAGCSANFGVSYQ